MGKYKVEITGIDTNKLNVLNYLKNIKKETNSPKKK